MLKIKKFYFILKSSKEEFLPHNLYAEHILDKTEILIFSSKNHEKKMTVRIK